MSASPSRMVSISPADPWRTLGTLTAARIALGRAGGSLPTRPLLAFQLAHTRARDAVQRDLDDVALAHSMGTIACEVLHLHSAAHDRRTFIARPDLGRILDDASRALLERDTLTEPAYDCAFIVADGLSAAAIENHAAALLVRVAEKLRVDHWRLAPMAIVRQGRVAIGDEIGALLGASMTVLLIGERPGLSAPDSLGVYLTYDPLPGRTNAQRNCISNIREPDGLSYAIAANRLYHLMTESRRRKLSGVSLKENASDLPFNADSLTSAAPPAK
jgi:ethanolamine ammonia-lyase small subunit